MGLGVAALNNDDRVDKEAATTPPHAPQAAGRRRADRGPNANEPQIGRALRSVYDQTVGEAIPAEMLELLGKLA